MAIYTRTAYSVLDTKALDAKTYYNSLSEYNADPYKYNGQIAYIKDAVEYYVEENASVSIYNTSDSLRFNLPGTNKYLDLFYISASEVHNSGINISGSALDPLTLDFQPESGGSAQYIKFFTDNGLPHIEMGDIDGNYIDYSSAHIYSYDDFSGGGSFLLGTYGLNIGESNLLEVAPSVQIGTGLMVNVDQPNSLIVGKYNDNEDPFLFSVGCGTDNSHRKNALTVDPSGCTAIDDLTVNGLNVYGGAIAYNILDLDYLNKNIRISLEGTTITQNSSTAMDGQNDIVLVNGYITGFKLCLTQAYKSTAKLNIFMYTDKTTKTPTKYILQNYPLGDLSVGDVAIEDLLITNGNSNVYIGFSITGADNTGKAHGLLQYCRSW